MEIAAAVAASHARSHDIGSTADHATTLTAGKLVRAGDLVAAEDVLEDGTNTDAEVAAVVAAEATYGDIVTHDAADFLAAGKFATKSPATLAEDRNDNVDLLDGATGIVYVRVTPHAGSSQISGIVAPASFTVLILCNTVHLAGGSVGLLDENANSTAANRICLKDGITVTFGYDAGLILIYDFTQSRWRMLY
jgi:hypothetical protein